MIFEDLPTAPTAEELVDQAFSRAARAGRAKSGVEAQRSMLLTASNVLHDNLQNTVAAWPDFRDVDEFYLELADAVLRRALDDVREGETGLDAIKQDLAEVSWAARKNKELGREYIGRIPNDTEGARKVRKQAFARMADVTEDVADNLAAIGAARDALKVLPDIRPDEPTIVVAGYPNVGKTSFINHVTNASNEIASYPFTTTGLQIGHFERERIRYQIVDTPGLLDRPAAERNEIEDQAVSAMVHLADAVLFFLDPSGTCGYPLEAQLALRDELEARFDVPMVTVANKSDLSTDVEADIHISVETEENVEEALDLGVDATGYEPELPFEG
jgi:nucleolar GTP-binding protein